MTLIFHSVLFRICQYPLPYSPHFLENDCQLSLFHNIITVGIRYFDITLPFFKTSYLHDNTFNHMRDLVPFYITNFALFIFAIRVWCIHCSRADFKQQFLLWRRQAARLQVFLHFKLVVLQVLHFRFCTRFLQ